MDRFDSIHNLLQTDRSSWIKKYIDLSNKLINRYTPDFLSSEPRSAFSKVNNQNMEAKMKSKTFF